jgi:hypothetical protein
VASDSVVTGDEAGGSPAIMAHKLTIQVAAKHATSAYENSFDQWIRKKNMSVDDLVRSSFPVDLAAKVWLIRRAQVGGLVSQERVLKTGRRANYNQTKADGQGRS